MTATLPSQARLALVFPEQDAKPEPLPLTLSTPDTPNPDDHPEAHPTDAVVFIVSKRSNTTHRRILWRVSRQDAMRICSDARTSGRNYMLCWTTRYLDDPDPDVNRYVRDRGQHADVLAELGVTVLDSLAIQQKAK